MWLPIFNKKARLQNLNDVSNQPVALTEDFGYAFFKEPLWTVQNNLIQQINTPGLLCTFTQDEKSRLQWQKKQASHLQARLHGTATSLDKPLTTQRSLEVMQQLKDKETLYRWIKGLRVKFEDDTWWQCRKNKSRRAYAVEQLHKKSGVIGSFAYASPDSLLLLVNDVLPLLVAHHKKARKALKWWYWFKMPGSLYQDYKAHLKSFLQQATLTQQALCETLLMRLEAYQDSGLRDSNLCVQWVRQLQSLQALAATEKMPQAREPLSSRQLRDSHDSLLLRGTDAQKTRLSALRWFSTPGQVSTKTRLVNGQWVLVPTTLAPLLPRKKSSVWCRRRGAFFRQHFFVDKLGFMIQLKMRTQPHQHTLTLQKLSLAKQLVDTININVARVASAEHEVREARKHFSRFYHKTTQQFLQQWDSVLQTQASQLLQEKMQVLEALMQSWHLEYPDLLSSAALPAQDFQWITTLVADMKQAAAALGVAENTPFLQKLQAYENRCSASQELRQVTALFTTLSQGRGITQTELQFLGVFRRKLSAAPQQQQRFLKQVAPDIQRCYTHLLQALKHCVSPRASVETISQSVCAIQSAIAVIETLGSQAMQEKVRRALPKAAFELMTVLHGFNREQWTQHAYFVEQMQALFQAVGKNTRFANCQLTNLLDELATLLEQSSYARAYTKLRLWLRQEGLVVLKAKVDKDLLVLKTHLFALLTAQKSDGSAASDLAVFEKVQQQWLAHPTEPHLTWKRSLSSSERIVLGLEQTTPTTPLIVLKTFQAATALQAKRQQTNTQFDQLWAGLQVAQQKTGDCINSYEKTAKLSHLLRTQSGRRSLFSHPRLARNAFVQQEVRQHNLPCSLTQIK